MSDPAETAPAWINATLRVTQFTDKYAYTKTELVASPCGLSRAIREAVAPTKAKLPWIKLATFGDKRSPTGSDGRGGNSLRWDDNVLEIVGIEADYDGGQVALETVRQLLNRYRIRAILYTSPSYTPDAPRWRILAFFAYPLEPIEREHMMARLQGVCATVGATFSTESWALSQAYYYGAVASSQHHKVLLIDGDAIDQLHDLDEIAVGKPAPTARGQVGSGQGGDANDVDALLADIVTTANYHVSTTTLAGIWVAQGKPLADALTLLRTAFRMVPDTQRDARWQERYDDITRCVTDVFRKHQRPEATIPRLREPAGLLDTRRYALAAMRKARARIADCPADDRENMLRVEARGLARFVRNEFLTEHEAKTALLDIALAAGVSLDTALTIVSSTLERGA
jgi:hypothetical protein